MMLVFIAFISLSIPLFRKIASNTFRPGMLYRIQARTYYFSTLGNVESSFVISKSNMYQFVVVKLTDVSVPFTLLIPLPTVIPPSIQA